MIASLYLIFYYIYRLIGAINLIVLQKGKPMLTPNFVIIIKKIYRIILLIIITSVNFTINYDKSSLF